MTVTPSAQTAGEWRSPFNTELMRISWDTGTVSLKAGTYYLAIQGVSTSFWDYLGDGSLASGAAETHDGGATWAAGYGGQNYASVAVDLFGSAVPEPGAWALMIVGLAAMGALLRRRQVLATA